MSLELGTWPGKAEGSEPTNDDLQRLSNEYTEAVTLQMRAAQMELKAG
jgi:hypothetical protein